MPHFLKMSSTASTEIISAPHSAVLSTDVSMKVKPRFVSNVYAHRMNWAILPKYCSSCSLSWLISSCTPVIAYARSFKIFYTSVYFRKIIHSEDKFSQ